MKILQYFLTMSSLQGFDNLLNTVVTVADRQAFLSSLETSSSALFRKDVPKALPENIVGFLKVNQVDLTDPELVKDFLEIIKDQVKDLPQIGLTCALDWSDASRGRLLAWFLQNLNQRVILDLKIDKSVVGGVLVEYAGVRADYSIATKLASK